jgi:hypothetical protein
MKTPLLIFFLTISFVFWAFPQTISDDKVTYQSTLKRISLKPYEEIVDTLSKDLDGDGIVDYVFIIQTNDKIHPIKSNDSTFRDPIITYFSKSKKIEKFSKTLPCFQCGSIEFTKSSILNIDIKHNEFVLTYIEIQDRIPIYHHYFIGYSSELKEMLLERRLRIIDSEDDCSYKMSFDNKIKLQDLDMTIDLFSDNLWFYKLADKKCSDIKNYRIIIPKSVIHTIPKLLTKMYLLKGDKVEVLEEKGEWLKVRYYGKKIIEGWIKKSDVE